MSIEGSTGMGAAAGAPAGGDVTSAASQQQGAGHSALSGVPAGFFDAGPAAADSMVGAAGVAGDADTGTGASSRAPTAAESGGTGAGGAGSAALPKGFFEDKKADAKARGEVPKNDKELAKEYADFLKAVEVDAAAAAEQQAQDEEEEAAGRLDREDFEQFVRMQKLEAIKEARQGAGVGGKHMLDEVDAEAAAAADAIAEPDVQRPVIHLAKKRRVLDTIASLEAAPGAGGSSSDDEGEDEEGTEELLDWRAKKSAF